jgi:branched-chain amino acid transport system permease protein
MASEDHAVRLTRPGRVMRWSSPGARLLMLAVVALVVAPQLVSFHYQDLLVQAFIFGVFVVSFDVLWGYAGVLSLGQSAFFGIGGYAIAVSVSQMGGGTGAVVVGIAAGVAIAVVLAAIVAWVTFFSRVAPIYIAVITLVVALVLERVMGLTSFQALSKYTGGYNGLGFSINAWTVNQWYWLTGIALLVTASAAVVLVRSDFGRVLTGIRDNEERLSYLGYRVPVLKLLVFVACAAVAALAGAAYTSYNHFASPDLLGLGIGIPALIYVSVGGRGTIIGPVIGALTVGLAGTAVSDEYPEYWELILGLVFVAVIVVLPRGLYPAIRGGLQRLWRPAPTTSTITRDAAATRPTAATGGAAGAPLAKVEGATKAFGGMPVLNGVDLEVHAGEILAILGPNGAGKSTLVSLITAPHELDQGTIHFGGISAAGRHPADVARLGVGRTFQGANLMETYSVADSLFIAQRRGRVGSLLRRTSEIPVPDEVLALDGASGLSDVLDVEVAELSHGKRQALELSLALALQPQVLLLDEPTAGLTHVEREVIGTLLKRLAERGFGIAVIEHDLDFVRSIADRVAVLHRGRMAIVGPTEEVAASQLVRDIYLGGAAE